MTDIENIITGAFVAWLATPALLEICKGLAWVATDAFHLS